VTDLATSLNEATLNGSVAVDPVRNRVSHQQMANAIPFLAVDAVDRCKALATFLRRMTLSSRGQRGGNYRA
jgi:hypothetical protein